MEKDKLITIILSIIIFIVPAAIIPQIWGQYNLIKIIVLLICGLILLITSLLNINKLKFDKQDIFILIFGLLAIFSTIFSINPITSLIGAKNRYEGLQLLHTF